ncbi:MAG: putative toxin-antitoxin system toxin component, PIN family [Saprospiraceae bacterium]|nr:putative toxin-antitoxin system toxin component, PIN family [Saprospiraceae bacterium]
MSTNPIKIVIDTNLWVSFILNQLKSPLRQLMDDENIEIITSQTLSDELFEVLNRPKFKNKIKPEIILTFQEYYQLFTLLIEVTSEISACRDPKDNYLLVLAKDAAADYLLTEITH